MSLAADRARQGSRRQRDLAALQAEQGNRWAVPADVSLTEQSTDAWAEVTSELYRTLHRSAITFWIGHCSLVGEHKGALVIAGPRQRAEWVRKRYAKHIGQAIRERTDYSGLRVCDE